jgi:hypothetical protein
MLHHNTVCVLPSIDLSFACLLSYLCSMNSRENFMLKGKMGYWLTRETAATECHGWMVNTPTSYLWGLGFKSQLRDRLSWLKFFMVFLSVPPAKCWDSTLKLSHYCSFQILSNSWFTYHPFTWWYVVLVTKKLPLNKIQIQLLSECFPLNFGCGHYMQFYKIWGKAEFEQVI